MALTKNFEHQGLIAPGAYIRAEVFARSGPKNKDGGAPYQSVIRIYASREIAASGTGHFADMNIYFIVAPGAQIEPSCYAAAKALPELADCLDC